MNRKEFLRLSVWGLIGAWSSYLIKGIHIATAREKVVEKTPKIGIIGAMKSEVDDIKAVMKITQQAKKADMEFLEGTLEDKEIVLVQCGMGKVNAGICAQILIGEFSVTHMINIGVAGALHGGLDIGDIVISTDAVQHDFDVEAIGFRKGEIPYTGKVAFEADTNLRQMAVQSVREVLPQIQAVEGRICSGDQFVTSQEEKERIIAEFAGYCVEMEGASIAQVCYLNGIPFVILRAMSDKVDGSGHIDFKKFEKEAAKHSCAIVQWMLKRWKSPK